MKNPKNNTQIILNALTINGYHRLPFLLDDGQLSEIDQYINFASDKPDTSANKKAAVSKYTFEEEKLCRTLGEMHELGEYLLVVTGLKSICHEIKIIAPGLYDGLWQQRVEINIKNSGDMPSGFGPVAYRGDRQAFVASPEAFLAGLLEMEIWLKDTDFNTGALQILPVSHRKGRIPKRIWQHMDDAGTPAYVPAKRGEIHFYRPLIMHRRPVWENETSLQANKPLSIRLSIAPRPTLPTPLSFVRQLPLFLRET